MLAKREHHELSECAFLRMPSSAGPAACKLGARTNQSQYHTDELHARGTEQLRMRWCSFLQESTGVAMVCSPSLLVIVIPPTARPMLGEPNEDLREDLYWRAVRSLLQRRCCSCGETTGSSHHIARADHLLEGEKGSSRHGGHAGCALGGSGGTPYRSSKPADQWVETGRSQGTTTSDGLHDGRQRG